MDFEPSEEHRKLKDLVGRFVRDELMPLEPAVLAREAAGQGLGLGMTKGLPLQLMASRPRTMRIYDGPTEVHKWVVARDLLGRRR